MSGWGNDVGERVVSESLVDESHESEPVRDTTGVRLENEIGTQHRREILVTSTLGTCRAAGGVLVS